MSDVEELKGYFRKLLKTIETQASFKWGKKHLLDKQRIDDILCCIDANFPEILKRYHKKYNNLDKNVKCFKSYNQLIANIKRKPLLGKNSYFVNYDQVDLLIPMVVKDIVSDMNYVADKYPDLNAN